MDTPLPRAATLRSVAVLGAVAAVVTLGLVAPAAAQDIPRPTGTIAFIEDRVRVHTIAPDGSDDTVIFGLTPEATSGIQSVSWRPDGQRLVMASGHEELCSIWVSDLYVMARDGTDLHRLTNGPSCSDQASLPTGTLRVSVANARDDTVDFLVHAQGLDAAQAITVQSGFQSTFELPVHDLGPDTPQFVVVSDGTQTWFDPAVFADVVAGGTADAGTLTIGADSLDTWGALSATWSHDGSRLAYQQGLGSLWQIPAAPQTLAIGTPLFTGDAGSAIAATTPTMAPLDDRVLYQRYDSTPSTVDLGRADADRVGDTVLAATLINGIDWLPDGSGFIASDSTELMDSANLVMVDLQNGAITQVTGYRDGFAMWPTISPDGQFVAYSYSPVPLDQATSMELHVRHLATGIDTVISGNGINADWGP